MTKKIYLQYTYQFHFEALIQGSEKDEKGMFIILDQTAFYPQGGGQPSDHGIIGNDHFKANVLHVTQHGDQIRHYIEPTATELLTAQKVYGVVDQKRRLINARYHTAGHLLGNIVEMINSNLKAIKGHSFPNEAYIEFQGGDSVEVEILQNRINDEIFKNQKIVAFEIEQLKFEKEYYKLPYTISNNKKFRVIQIGDMLPVPCGGTHLNSTAEIGSIRINKIKNKNKTLRISYEVL